METILKDGKNWPLQQELSAVSNITVAVTNPADCQLLPANPNRKFLIVMNDEPVAGRDIFLAFGVTAELFKGIQLVNAGGKYLMTRENLFTGEIRAIAVVNGTAAVIAEGT